MRCPYHTNPLRLEPNPCPLAAARYENVGMSLFLVAALSIALPPVFAVMFWGMRKARQACLVNCVGTASQDTYNAAWLGDAFQLDYRWEGQEPCIIAGALGNTAQAAALLQFPPACFKRASAF